MSLIPYRTQDSTGNTCTRLTQDTRKLRRDSSLFRAKLLSRSAQSPNTGNLINWSVSKICKRYKLALMNRWPWCLKSSRPSLWGGSNFIVWTSLNSRMCFEISTESRRIRASWTHLFDKNSNLGFMEFWSPFRLQIHRLRRRYVYDCDIFTHLLYPIIYLSYS